MKTWTIVEMDMSDHLTKTVKPEHFKIPAGLELKFNIELDDKIYDKLHKDAVWVNDMRKKAIAKGLASLDKMEAEAKRIDLMYTALHPSDVQPFILKLQTLLKTEMKTAGDAMAKEINLLIADYKKKKKELSNFNIKCVGKISSSVGSIAVSTGIAAASHGAGLPFVIIGIVKDMAQIAQQCAKLAADVDHYETLVQKELALLGVFIEKHAKDVTPKAKAKGKKSRRKSASTRSAECWESNSGAWIRARNTSRNTGLRSTNFTYSFTHTGKRSRKWRRASTTGTKKPVKPTLLGKTLRHYSQT
jgi:hypothetical protein